MADDELPGETVEIEAPADDVQDTDDGGAIVTLGEEEERSEDFLKNLAEELPEPELQGISSQFLDLIEKDKEARKKRDDQYEEGIRRTGLGDDAPGGAQFEGASKVVHPMLTEACVDFAARAMGELFPTGGPVTDSIPGDITQEKLAKAQRKTRLLNFQLTTQCPEFRAELEQLITQLPLGGSQYLKVTWDEDRNRPQFLFVAIDEMYLPYAASNFYTAQRKTHVQFLTELDYKQRVKSGMYRDVDLAPPSMEPEQSGAAKATDKIEGREQDSYNADGLRTVFEVHTLYALEGDDLSKGEVAPYIITIDKPSGKVLSIYRNWDEPDESREELHWFVEFSFIPWRGAYALGLPQMIGGLSGAATGALRALLDSAHIQNIPSGIRLKSKVSGQSKNPQPGEIPEVEGGVNVDDIRKIFMPMPYNQPSPVLFQLLGFVVDAGRGVVRTTLEDIADTNANVPVGTTMARLQEGLKVFSAIHGRAHASMDRLLKILGRLNGTYLDDERLEAETGEELATRKDFDGPLDVVPVSDPEIFSDVQRITQVQTVASRADLKPQLYEQRTVELELLQTLKIPNPERFLVPAPEPKEQNAVNENAAAALGRPVTAFPEQDHLAHLKTHLDFMLSPVFGQNPLIAPAFIPVMLNHFREHLAWWYASSVFEASNFAAGGDIGTAMQSMKSEDRKELDRMLVNAGAVTIEFGDQLFAQLPQVIQQAMQMMQQLAPQPQPDPFVQIEGQKIQQREAEGQRKDALKREEIQIDAAKDDKDRQADMERERLRQSSEDQRKAAELAARDKMNTDDNQTAKELAAAEILSDEKVGISTGTRINPNPGP